ncbi:MAG TPA: hypothetical protein VD994_06130 [Prosthecobacter sp.]|nr:hypothetical protein [Prosthecobacter sp.]
MQQLNQLLARLIASEVEFVLVGGLAAAIHGSSLNTRDVDICIELSPENLMRIQTAFADLHPVHRSRPDIPLNLTPEDCPQFKNLYLKTDLGIVDCLGEVLGVGKYDDVLRHSIVLDLPVGSCRILDIDTLIRAKEAMGRPHDLVTVQHLKALRSLKK